MIRNKKNYLLRVVIIFGLNIFISSCKTYFIPVDSFRQQFAALDSSKMREVSTQGPLGERVKYTTYPIDSIQAMDKNGNAVSIPVSPSIEIRITDTSNRKTIFYFDLMRFDGENIVGSRSRIISSIKRTILINAVKKIEVQNGGKSYSYNR